MDLNPVALLPSAHIPFIPYTGLKVDGKIYGDAEETLSDSTMTLALDICPELGSGFVGVSGAV